MFYQTKFHKSLVEFQISINKYFSHYSINSIKDSIYKIERTDKTKFYKPTTNQIIWRLIQYIRYFLYSYFLAIILASLARNIFKEF